jgi:predicted RNA-binding protein with PUA-like domain
MAYWLLKTEPGVYSFMDLRRDGKTRWDGVTNNLALKHMRAMTKGDNAFIYHSGDEKAIVGIAQLRSDPYPDPNKKEKNIVVVDLNAGSLLHRPIPLSEIKSIKSFASFELVRLPRLSVMPVSTEMWNMLIKRSKQEKKEEQE